MAALFSDSATAALTADQVEDAAQAWLLDGEFRKFSKTTLNERRWVMRRFVDYLKTGELVADSTAIKRFLSAMAVKRDGGNKKPVTNWGYFRDLKAFFNWCAASDEVKITQSPMASLKGPIVRQETVNPLTIEEMAALVEASRHDRHHERDHAIVLLMLDSGLRTSELCNLRVSDVDLNTRQVLVRMGKGNKARTVCIGAKTTKAVWAYLKYFPAEKNEYLFRSERGNDAGAPLTRSGVLRIIATLGKAAGIQRNCYGHLLRHSFAISFLRNGANPFSLQMQLGHSGLAMTRRYAAVAEADLQAAHRLASPVDHLMRK